MFEIVCVCMCVLVQVIRRETLEFGIHTRHWPNDRTIIVDTMMWQWCSHRIMAKSGGTGWWTEECIRSISIAIVATIAWTSIVIIIIVTVTSITIWTITLVKIGWSSWFIVDGGRYLLNRRWLSKRSNHWSICIIMWTRWTMYTNNTMLSMIRPLSTTAARWCCRCTMIHCLMVRHLIDIGILIIIFNIWIYYKMKKKRY